MKTLKKIQELQKQLVPSSTIGKGEDSTDMEINTMFQRKEEEDKGTDEESSYKMSESLFFMEPDHKEFRETEDQETQEYWEAGITKESLNVLRSGGVDHSQKQCYHCSQKGHINANCPTRRKLGTQTWKKRPEREPLAPRKKEKLVVKDRSDGRETKGRKTMKRISASNKRPEGRTFGKPKHLQEFGEDF